MNSPGIGDRIGQALSIVGITPNRVTNWLGKPCGCEERKEKLNRLETWVLEFFRGNKETSKEELEEILRS